MRCLFKQYFDLFLIVKRTLKARRTNFEKIKKIQFFRQIIQVSIHDNFDEIFRLHRQQSSRVDEFQQNENNLNIIDVYKF